MMVFLKPRIKGVKFLKPNKEENQKNFLDAARVSKVEISRPSADFYVTLDSNRHDRQTILKKFTY